MAAFASECGGLSLAFRQRHQVSRIPPVSDGEGRARQTPPAQGYLRHFQRRDGLAGQEATNRDDLVQRLPQNRDGQGIKFLFSNDSSFAAHIVGRVVGHFCKGIMKIYFIP
jgi:hypothetical protein